MEKRRQNHHNSFGYRLVFVDFFGLLSTTDTINFMNKVKTFIPGIFGYPFDLRKKR
jgi:hypothetical protein